MATLRKSENQKYRLADLKRPFDNIKEAMGLTGNADSNYYTNLGKVSRYEGSELDNIGKRGTLDALGQVLATMVGPGFEKDRYQANLGLTGKAGDYARSRTTDDLRPDLVRKGGFEADKAGSEAGVAEMITRLAKQIEGYGKPDIANYDTSNPNEMRPYEDAIKQSAGDFEEIVRKLRALGMKGDAHKTAGQQADLVGGELDKKKAVVSYYEAREKAVQALTEPKVKEIEARTKKTLSDMGVNSDIGTAKINKINQAALDAALIAQQRGLNLQETNALIKKNTEIAAEKLVGAKADTSKKVTQAASELTKHWDLPKQLYLKAQKLQQEINKLKTQNQTAESKQRVQELTEEYQITIKKAQAAQAQSDASKSKSNANIAGQNQKVHAQKLLDLQTTRTNIIDRGKVALKKARTESDRADINLRIEKELEPIEIAIKKLSLEKGKADLQKTQVDTRKSIINTPSPSDLKRKRQNVQARTDASNRSKSGSSSGDTTDQLIKNLVRGVETTASPAPTTTTATSRKGTGADPVAMEIFNSLMSTVEPEVLRSWTPEETNKAVAMIKQKHPDMNEERIRRLIQTAQRRSQQ
jgi:hypothetical protein